MITIVLLCSGYGSKTQSYRPNKDDSQWWCRRDALVRCVSGSLFSSALSNHVPLKLILLYDGDGSMMVMTPRPQIKSTLQSSFSLKNESSLHKSISTNSILSPSSKLFVPTERNIIASWRRASEIAHQSNDSKNKNISDSSFNFNIYDSYKISLPRYKEEHLPFDVELLMPESSLNSSFTDTKKIKNTIPHPKDIDSIQSKRDLLSYIRSKCPFDYMKQCKLNSSDEVILRKYNRPKLEKIWVEWCTVNHQEYLQSSKNVSNDNLDNDPFEKSHLYDTTTEESSLLMKNCFLQIFNQIQRQQQCNPNNESKSTLHQHKKRKNNCQNYNDKIIAVYLHESCSSELPIDEALNLSSTDTENQNCHSHDDSHIVLFMGAVRDMSAHEHTMLQSICSDRMIPYVGCRLGPVAEFSSKILQVISYHGMRGRLVPGIRKLCQKKQTIMNSNIDIKLDQRSDSNLNPSTIPRDCIHVVVNLPISSNMLTTDISKRSFILWSIVRISVCTLWRSKVASSRCTNLKNVNVSCAAKSTKEIISSTELENVLSLVFDDGISITIDQETIVDSLAEKHQAAPSEYQILEALCRLRDKQLETKIDNKVVIQSRPTPNELTIEGWNKLYDNLLKSTSDTSSTQQEIHSNKPFLCAIDIRHDPKQKSSNTKLFGKHEKLVKLLYAENSEPYDTSSHRNVFVILNIDDEVNVSKCSKIMKRQLVKSLERLNIPILKECIVPSQNNDCQVLDRSATSITMLQHFQYQGKLFSCLKKRLRMS